MANTLIGLKVKKYMSKPTTPRALDASIDEAIIEKTQAQLEEYKVSRKLPLLGVNFHRIKDRPVQRQKRNNLSAIDAVIPPEEILFKEATSFILTPLKISTPIEMLGKDTQLENMIGEWESQKASPHSRFLSVSPFAKGYTERVSPHLSSPRTKEEIPDTAGSFILDRSPQNLLRRQSTKEEPYQKQQGIKPIANYLGFEYNDPYKLSMKKGSIRGKPRSKSIQPGPLKDLNGGKHSPREEKSRLRTETDVKTRDRKNTMVSSSEESPSPVMRAKFIRAADKHLSDASTCASPNISVIKGFYQQTKRYEGEGSSLPNLDKKEGRQNKDFVLQTTKDVALGGKIFYHTDVLQSKLPINAIEHPSIQKVKALNPNHILMGRQLQLPLTNVMETVLKKTEIKSLNPKNSRNLGPLDEYGKVLLKGTFRDYYHEINPLGRLQSQEIELLNGQNQKYRARRGLPITTNHHFTSEFFDGSPETNANKKSQKLLEKLRLAQETDIPLGEVIKEHRKEMPIEMNKKFLENSFETTLQKMEIRENIASKIKKYDAWYVAPEERQKRFSGVFASSLVQRNRFKHRPSEQINLESIRKISKEYEEFTNGENL